MKRFHIGLLAIVFVVSGNLFASDKHEGREKQVLLAEKKNFEAMEKHAAISSGHMMAERLLLEGTKVLAEKVDHAALHNVPGLTKDQMVEMVNGFVYDFGKTVVEENGKLSKKAAHVALLGLSAKLICHYIKRGAEKALHIVLTKAHVKNTDPLKGYELQKFFVMNLLSKCVQKKIVSCGQVLAECTSGLIDEISGMMSGGSLPENEDKGEIEPSSSSSSSSD